MMIPRSFLNTTRAEMRPTASPITGNGEKQITYQKNGDTSPFLVSQGIPEGEIRKIDPTFSYSEPNTGSAVTLKKFITWGIKAFPAKHYFLIMQGHSWGKLGLMMDFLDKADGKSLEKATMMTTWEFRRGIFRGVSGARKRIPTARKDRWRFNRCLCHRPTRLFYWNGKSFLIIT